MRPLLLFTALFASAAFGQTSLDVRVDGPGCLRFTEGGKALYAKSARLVVIGGALAESSGPRVAPRIAVPTGARSITVALDGTVTCDGQSIGTLVLAVFPDDPTSVGLFSSPLRPALMAPGTGDAGVVRTGDAPVVKVTLSPTAAATPAKPTSQPNTSSVPGQLTIRLNGDATVAGSEILLEDIADVQGPELLKKKAKAIVLGAAPSVGLYRIVDQVALRSRLATAGIPTAQTALTGPARCRVTRQGAPVTHEQFVQSAIRGASVKGLGQSFESVSPGPEMTVPIGSMELVCESVSGSGGEVNVVVAVYVDGKRFNSRSVRLRATGPAATLKTGAPVKVRVVSPGVSITVDGTVVRVNHGTGQVSVKVAATGAVLNGIVLADGTVEVKA